MNSSAAGPHCDFNKALTPLFVACSLDASKLHNVPLFVTMKVLDCQIECDEHMAQKNVGFASPLQRGGHRRSARGGFFSPRTIKNIAIWLGKPIHFIAARRTSS